MVWNFEDGMEGDVNLRCLDLTIGSIPFSGAYRLLHYRIDAQHSSAYAAWKSMGKPAEPTLDQIKTLRAQEGLALFEPVRDVTLDGSFSITLDLPMHAVSLLLLVPQSSEQPTPPQGLEAAAEQGFNGNPQVFLKWQPNAERDFLHYRLLRQLGDGEFESIVDHVGQHTAVYTDMDVSPGETYAYKVQAINASGQVSAPSNTLRVTC